MKLESDNAYTIGLKVLLVEMEEGDDFSAINSKAEYDWLEDDIVLTVTYKHAEDKTIAWAITWLAVPNHEDKTVDSGLLTSAAAIRLLRLAPQDQKTTQRALDIVEKDYERRRNAK